MSEPLSASDLSARIETLLRANDFGRANWNTSSAPAVVLTYQFESAAQADASPQITGITAFTNQQPLIRQAIAEYESVVNVDFQERSGIVDPDISFYVASSLGNAATAGLGGWSYTGNNWDSFASYRSNIDLTQQSNYDLVLHEIGHALGLKHPGDYDVASGGGTPPYLPAAEDNDKFTVMSYITNPTNNADSRHLMLYDIAALQLFWGANMTTRTGNNVYTGPDDGRIQAIWDAGGIDTMQYTGAGNAVLDLRAGTFSSLGAVDNYAIAYGVTIESAIGGSGSDLIRGNYVANSLSGGNGNDTVSGGASTDYMAGGIGDDTYAVDNGGDIVAELAGQGNDTVYSTVSYALLDNVENLLLVGSAANGTGNTLTNYIYGSALANRLDGGAGGDGLTGGGGNDTLVGGAGVDGMAGGTGDDTYAVDDLFDVLLENPGEGNDIVYSTVTHVLEANVESLLLVGGGAAWAIGNTQVNYLFGNVGNNYIDGGGAADVMTGGGGNDVFRLRRGEFNGDMIGDFAAGDLIQFQGYNPASTVVSALGGNLYQALDFSTGALEVFGLTNGHALAGGSYSFV